MDAHASFDESIPFVPKEPAVDRRRSRGRRLARRVGAAVVAGLLALVVGAGVVHAVRQSRLDQCDAHLKRLGQALNEYHEAHGHFPAPALAAPDGTPLLSWRVAILPHLGYRSLYERFRLNEPWSSPHNRALIAEMPPELACPGGPGVRSGRTGYLVVVGPKSEPTSVNTPFEPARGVDLREITDGTSNTALIFETDRPVVWTRPEDLRWSQGGPPPRLTSPHAGGPHVLFADGMTRFLAVTTRPAILLALLTINGGELTGG
jgi:hypothetical protein